MNLSRIPKSLYLALVMLVVTIGVILFSEKKAPADNKGGVPTTLSPAQLPNLRPYQPSGWSDKIVVSKSKGTYTDSSPLYTTDSLYVDWAVINDGPVATPRGFSKARMSRRSMQSD